MDEDLIKALADCEDIPEDAKRRLIEADRVFSEFLKRQESQYKDIDERLKEKRRNSRESSTFSKKGEFYFFISLDLVNSTEFKNIYSLKNSLIWIQVIKEFFEISKNQFRVGAPSEQRKFSLWKTLGDEVLIYAPVYSLDDLKQKFLEADKHIKEIQDEVSNFKNDFLNILSVKGSAWIAKVYSMNLGKKLKVEVDSEGQVKESVVNIKTFLKENLGELFFEGMHRFLPNPRYSRIFQELLFDLKTKLDPDFLGPDIDIGFRGAQYSWSRRLQVSLDLAYLLSSYDNDLLKTFKILQYKELKGVWNRKPYPIIWYDPVWGEENWDIIDYKKSFDYDDCLKNEMVKDIIDEKIDLKKETLIDDFIRVLRKVGGLERLENYLEELSKETYQEPV